MSNKELIKQETKEVVEMIEEYGKKFHLPKKIVDEIRSTYVNRMATLAKNVTN